MNPRSSAKSPSFKTLPKFSVAHFPDSVSECVSGAPDTWRRRHLPLALLIFY